MYSLVSADFSLEVTGAFRNLKNRLSWKLAYLRPWEWIWQTPACSFTAIQLYRHELPTTHPHHPTHPLPWCFKHCSFRDLEISFRFQNTPKRGVAFQVATYGHQYTWENGFVWLDQSSWPCLYNTLHTVCTCGVAYKCPKMRFIPVACSQWPDNSSRTWSYGFEICGLVYDGATCSCSCSLSLVECLCGISGVFGSDPEEPGYVPASFTNPFSGLPTYLIICPSCQVCT